MCVAGGGGGGGCILGVLWLLNAVSSFQHSPLPQVPLCDFGDSCPCTRGGWCVCEVGRGDSPTTQHHPPRVPTSGGAAQPTRGGHGGDGAQPLCQVGNTVTFVHPTELRPPPLLFLARSLSLMHVRERGP